MIPRTALTPRQFDQLAAGGGDTESVTVLRVGEYSRNMLLIQSVLDSAWHGPAADARMLQGAYALLTSAQRARPDVVTAVLGQPNVSLWAAACLRAADTPAKTTPAHHGYLAWLAASAALRAGLAFEIELPLVAGGITRPAGITLPGLGTTVGSAGDAGLSRVCADGERATLSVAGRPPVTLSLGRRQPGWTPQHFLRGQDGEGDAVFTVRLDDRDPYRAPPWTAGVSPLSPAPPLRPGEVSRWQHLFAQAWRILARQHPGQARAMRTGLLALVPMTAGAGVLDNSATALDAFGMVLLTPPQDHVSLALTMLHEFQHGKLAALAHLVTLHDPDGEPRFYAPWRDDPRPIGALLQGAYAHLAVAEFQREQSRRVGGEAKLLAQVQFAACRDDVREAIDQLARSGELTSMGERFVAGMSAALDGWRSDEPPLAARRIAADSRARDRLSWRLRHLAVDPGDTDRIARAWLAVAGGHAPQASVRTATTTLRPGPRAARGSIRQSLALRASLRAGGQPDGPPARREAASPPVSPGDLAYARGRRAQAVTAYLDELAANPAEPDTWAGLALAARQPRLASQPELVRAVYLRVRELGAPAPDPIRLAAWLAQTTP